MNFIRRMGLALAVAASACFVQTALATATTISEPTELDVQHGNDITNWCPLTVNADLSVITGGKLWVPYNGKIYLPGGTGYDATLRTEGTGVIVFYYPEPDNANTLVIGKNGGKGHIVCAGTADNMLNYLTVEANAEADASGYVDYLCVSGGSFRCSQTIKCTSPARVRMAGGMLCVAKSSTGVVRDLFNVASGSKLVWESVGGANLNLGLNQGDKGPWVNLNAGEGKFETKGAGKLYIGQGGGMGCHVYFLMGPDRATWGHAGDTIFHDNFTAVVCCDQALPHGPKTGGILFDSSNQSQPKYIDLNGHTTEVNYLGYSGDAWQSQQCSWVTNSSTTAEGVIQFGGVNTNLTMTANLRFCTNANVVVEKIGTATLTIKDGASGVYAYPHLRVSSGTLALQNMAADTLEVTGGVCRISTGVTLAHVRVTGGAIDLVNGATLACADVVCTGTGQIRRTYESDATLAATASATSALHVAGGTLTVYDSDRDNKYWRVELRKAHGQTTNLSVKDPSTGEASGETQAINVALQRFHLFGYQNAKPDNGSRLNSGMTSAAAGTAATALEAGQVTSAKPWLTGSYRYDTGSMWIESTGPAAVCSSLGSWSENIAWNNGVLTSETASTWETITMRLAEGKNHVSSFVYVTSGYQYPVVNPVSMRVSCSANGADPWIVKWEGEGLGNRHYKHPAYYHKPDSGDPYDVTSLTNNPHGSFTTCPQIEVDAGATLAFDCVPKENIAFNGLTVDVDAGAGTIAYFAPAAEGNLYLNSTNTVGEGVLSNGPTFTEMGGTKGNLMKWTVYVNGTPKPLLRARLTTDGHITIGPRYKGLRVIVR